MAEDQVLLSIAQFREDPASCDIIEALCKGDSLETRDFLRPIFKWCKSSKESTFDKCFEFATLIETLSSVGIQQLNIPPQHHVHPVYMYNTIIVCSQRAGNYSAARRAFLAIRRANFEPDVFAYTALLDIAGRTRNVSDCLGMYEYMLRRTDIAPIINDGDKHFTVQPNLVTFSTIFRLVGSFVAVNLQELPPSLISEIQRRQAQQQPIPQTLLDNSLVPEHEWLPYFVNCVLDDAERLVSVTGLKSGSFLWKLTPLDGDGIGNDVGGNEEDDDFILNGKANSEDGLDSMIYLGALYSSYRTGSVILAHQILQRIKRLNVSPTGVNIAAVLSKLFVKIGCTLVEGSFVQRSTAVVAMDKMFCSAVSRLVDQLLDYWLNEELISAEVDAACKSFLNDMTSDSQRESRQKCRTREKFSLFQKGVLRRILESHTVETVGYSSSAKLNVFHCLGPSTSLNLRRDILQQDLDRLLKRFENDKAISDGGTSTVCRSDFITLMHQCKKRKWGLDEIDMIMNALSDVSKQFPCLLLTPNFFVYAVAIETTLGVLPEEMELNGALHIQQAHRYLRYGFDLIQTCDQLDVSYRTQLEEIRDMESFFRSAIRGFLSMGSVEPAIESVEKYLNACMMKRVMPLSHICEGIIRACGRVPDLGMQLCIKITAVYDYVASNVLYEIFENKEIEFEFEKYFKQKSRKKPVFWDLVALLIQSCAILRNRSGGKILVMSIPELLAAHSNQLYPANNAKIITAVLMLSITPYLSSVVDKSDEVEARLECFADLHGYLSIRLQNGELLFQSSAVHYFIVNESMFTDNNKIEAVPMSQFSSLPYRGFTLVGPLRHMLARSSVLRFWDQLSVPAVDFPSFALSCCHTFVSNTFFCDGLACPSDIIQSIINRSKSILLEFFRRLSSEIISVSYASSNESFIMGLFVESCEMYQLSVLKNKKKPYLVSKRADKVSLKEDESDNDESPDEEDVSGEAVDQQSFVPVCESCTDHSWKTSYDAFSLQSNSMLSSSNLPTLDSILSMFDANPARSCILMILYISSRLAMIKSKVDRDNLLADLNSCLIRKWMDGDWKLLMNRLSVFTPMIALMACFMSLKHVCDVDTLTRSLDTVYETIGSIICQAGDCDISNEVQCLVFSTMFAFFRGLCIGNVAFEMIQLTTLKMFTMASDSAIPDFKIIAVLCAISSFLRSDHLAPRVSQYLRNSKAWELTHSFIPEISLNSYCESFIGMFLHVFIYRHLNRMKSQLSMDDIDVQATFVRSILSKKSPIDVSYITSLVGKSKELKRLMVRQLMQWNLLTIALHFCMRFELTSEDEFSHFVQSFREITVETLHDDSLGPFLSLFDYSHFKSLYPHAAMPPVLVCSIEQLVSCKNDLHDNSQFSSTTIVGFDCEWKPNSSHTAFPVAVFQISTEHVTYLLDFMALKDHIGLLSEFLTFVFSDLRFLKVGFSCRQDLERLGAAANIPSLHHQAVRVIDLRNMFTSGACLEVIDSNSTVSGGSLSSLCKLVSGMGIDKRLQQSQWESRPLSPEQMLYAATDAWACVAIYMEMQARLSKKQVNIMDLDELSLTIN